MTVYDKPFDDQPVEVLEFTGTQAEVRNQLEAWANSKEVVVFDLEIIDNNQMSAQYGLTTGGPNG